MASNRLRVTMSILLTAWAVSVARACSLEEMPSVKELMSIPQEVTWPAEPDKQWLFPSILFSCSVNVTGWVFRVAEDTLPPTVSCPKLELWREYNYTLHPTTDYIREVGITEYSRPQKLSDFVFRCNLTSPLQVPAGTVIGFTTNSNERDFNFRFMADSDSPGGYCRHVASGAGLYDTARTNSVQEVVPLIAAVYGDDNEGYTTKLNSTTSSPAPATRTPLIPMSSSAAFTINGVPEREFHIVVIAVAVVVTSILLIATVVVVVLIIVLIRRKRLNRRIEPKNDQSQSISKSCVNPVVHEYEDLDNLHVEKKDEYEFLSSKPSNYEVPQPSIKSKSEENCKNTLQYDVPGTIVNQYETPMDAWGALRCGITLTEPTPVDAEHTESMLVASGAYEPMWSGETSDSRYGSIYLSEGDSQTTGQSPKHGFQPTDPIDVPTNVHIRNVRHSEGSLLFMQSIVHSVASL